MFHLDLRSAHAQHFTPTSRTFAESMQRWIAEQRTKNPRIESREVLAALEAVRDAEEHGELGRKARRERISANILGPIVSVGLVVIMGPSAQRVVNGHPAEFGVVQWLFLAFFGVSVPARMWWSALRERRMLLLEERGIFNSRRA